MYPKYIVIVNYSLLIQIAFCPYKQFNQHGSEARDRRTSAMVMFVQEEPRGDDQRWCQKGNPYIKVRMEVFHASVFSGKIRFIVSLQPVRRDGLLLCPADFGSHHGRIRNPLQEERGRAPFLEGRSVSQQRCLLDVCYRNRVDCYKFPAHNCQDDNVLERPWTKTVPYLLQSWSMQI